MKKVMRICLVGLMIGILSFANLAFVGARAQEPAGPVPENVKIAKDVRGVDVIEIQTRLRTLGYYENSRNSEVMDNETLYALKLFCAAHEAEYSDYGITHQAYDVLMNSTNLIPRVTPAPTDEENQYAPLYHGQEGDAVLNAQMRLKELGYYEGYTLNPGVYDWDFFYAIRDFCTENNIEFVQEELVVSVSIRRLLFSNAVRERYIPQQGDDEVPQEIAAGYKYMVGAEDTDIGTLQDRLKELGYYTENRTYELDLDTMYALKQLCFENHLVFDDRGITHEMWELLFSNEPLITVTVAPTAGPSGKDYYGSVAYGQQDDTVAKLQQQLQAMGYLTGEYVLGLYGETTQQAVESFCEFNHMLYSGEGVDAQLHAAIFSDNALPYVEQVVELGTFQKVRAFLVEKQLVLGMALPGWVWTICGVVLLAGVVFLMIMLFAGNSQEKEEKPEQKLAEAEASDSVPRSRTIVSNVAEKSIATVDISIRYQQQEHIERVHIADNCIIGRTAECEIRLDDKDRSMSRQHCTLHMRGGGVVLVDHSVNGTFVNDHHYHKEECNLHSGDRVQIGQHLLVFKF